MLEGKPLGAALKAAFALKNKQLVAAGKPRMTQKSFGKLFEVAQSSVGEWFTDGRISKRHIHPMVTFFRDVVGPEHWGLPAGWTPLSTIPFRDLNALEAQLITFFRSLSEDEQGQFLMEIDRRRIEASLLMKTLPWKPPSLQKPVDEDKE